jgi:hypothetical protein
MVRSLSVGGVCLLFAACGGRDGPTPPVGVACEGSTTPVVVDLAPGEAHVAAHAVGSGCIELAQPGGRYVIAVVNAATAPGTFVGFRLRGLAGTSAAVAEATQVVVPSAREFVLPPGHMLESDVRFRSEHQHMVERNRQLARTLPRIGRASAQDAGAAVVLPAVSTTVGSISPVRIADIDNTAPLCSQLPFQEIQARTVFVGARSIIVEDVNAPFAGTMDAVFTAIGEEFDQVMWPILTGNFGNPLRLDSQLDNNQRVVMVFSPVVNNFSRSVAGFVISCDFGARATIPSSNEGEYFYAMVPDQVGTGFSGFTVPNWRRLMRATVIHEVKHITAYAERLAQNFNFEAAWLEESTAMIAEELWARVIYGKGWKQNITYEESVYCDVRPTWPECLGEPAVMISHFLLMYRYLSEIEALSPIGDPPGQDGSTFYGSGWSLVRWAVDQFAASESAFLQALTQSPQTGITNLEMRSGRVWGELVAPWSLANAVSDRAGFAPQTQRVTHPSWNYRNMYQRLNADLPQTFTRAYPLVPRALSFGVFSQSVTQLAGGTASVFELSGAGVNRQLLELRGVGGATIPQTLRIAIVRIE